MQLLDGNLKRGQERQGENMVDTYQLKKRKTYRPDCRQTTLFMYKLHCMNKGLIFYPFMGMEVSFGCLQLGRLHRKLNRSRIYQAAKGSIDKLKGKFLKNKHKYQTYVFVVFFPEYEDFLLLY